MRRLGPTLVLLAGMLALAAPAPAATGDLTFKDCIAKFAIAPCTGSPNDVLEGGRDVAVSPNGQFVYVADSQDSILWFKRSAVDGSVTYQGCVHGGDDVGCGLPQAVLQAPRSLAFSPDGTSLYAVASTSETVVRFTVGIDGALTFAGCAEKDDSLELGCGTEVPNFDIPQRVAVAPDGNVYVTSDDATLTHLSSSLTLVGCYREAITAGCAQAEPLQGADGLAISSDGAYLYAPSIGRDAITWFKRALDGSLTVAGCLSDDDDTSEFSDKCAEESGVDYDFMNHITLNPTGTHAYVTDETGLGVVYHFSRDAITGALTRQDCLADDLNVDAPGCTELDETTGSGLSSVTDAVVSPDSANLYAAARQDNALSTFGLSVPGGALSFIRCVRAIEFHGCSAFPGSSSVIDSPQGTAMSPDGHDLYVSNGAGIPALLHFEREAPGTRTGGGSGPGPDPVPDPDPDPDPVVDPPPPPPPPPVVKCGGRKATIVGTNRSEKLRGTRKRDVIAARGGNDKVKGLGGNDIVCGEGGRDSLNGGPGSDRLLGGPGKDLLKGAGGRDFLLGGPGGDRLLGGPGRDSARQ